MLQLFSRFLGLFRKKHPLKDVAPLKGKLRITLKDKDGKIKQQKTVQNTIETAGKNMIADQLLASPTLGIPSYMGVGSGSPVGGDLASPIERAAITSIARTDNVVTMTALFAAGVGTGAITEYGIFDAASDGNCLATTTGSVVNKGAADTLEVEWQWTIG